MYTSVYRRITNVIAGRFASLSSQFGIPKTTRTPISWLAKGTRRKHRDKGIFQSIEQSEAVDTSSYLSFHKN